MAFRECKGLTSITLPQSVTSLEDGVFIDCTSLTNISVDSRNNAYMSADGIVFDKTGKILICCPAGKTGAYTIPSSVTTIGRWAFYKCSVLTSVTIPSSVTAIRQGAFITCSGLTSITIPSSITSIADGTFFYCSGLTSVNIPSSVTAIEKQAFDRCESLPSVTIPSSVTAIGDEAFNRCESLTSVTLSRHTQVGKDAFPGKAKIQYRD